MKDLIFTLFGATGDLALRKLLPAIKRLLEHHQLPENTLVIAVGRRPFSTDEYFDYVLKNQPDHQNIDRLRNHFIYQPLGIDHVEDYRRLKDLIHSQSHSTTRHIFYLALSPDLFPVVSIFLSQTQLIEKGNVHQSIAFEKPFGHDLESAKRINQTLWSCFDEEQIYRIDHYLGKEMIQNIMVVRFANRIFEEAWDNRSIKKVTIVAKETDGILQRGLYYDHSGALKDMVQSHLLQMLSMVAMEVPMSYRSEDVKNEKVKVLKQLTFDSTRLVLGQYEGYLNEKDVQKHSQTETYVEMVTYVNTPRFKGVPFVLITGKKMDSKESYITIEFEETNEQRKWNLPLSSNRLHIKIAPLDGVSLVLNSKVPGLTNDVEQVELEYCIACQAVGNMTEAYEKLLIEMMAYHKSLFTRWDEIELSWKFIDRIKQIEHQLVIYKDYQDLQAKKGTHHEDL